MGEQRVTLADSGAELRAFMQAVIRDLDAMRYMIEQGLFEVGVRRIGAEQEFFLVDSSCRPAGAAMELLDRLRDDGFTTELGIFNLELNLAPLTFAPGCLSACERNLTERVEKLRRVAEEIGVQPVMSGILPTLRASDLVLENMTPRERYYALNEALRSLGGGRFGLRVHGVDEVSIAHDSVMMESACTSFQVHFQVEPGEFADLYNIAQVVVAPLLAAATNAPMLFGRRLWRETRVPLFQQAIDTRGSRYYLRELRPRVRFGHQWVEASVIELFAHDIASFRPLLASEVVEDPFETLESGGVPRLGALAIFAGTVYRWNRPCYGVSGGKPHLRIEMRALPAGPSIVDEVANASLFFGLLIAIRDAVDDVRDVMSFADARSNFFAAAQYGLDAQMRWFGHELVPVRALLLERLIPQARDALRAAGIDQADVDRYVDIVEARVDSGRTGSQWLLDSAAALATFGTREEVLTTLTAATINRQRGSAPAHAWELARPEEGVEMQPKDLRVEEFMTTNVFSVDPEEPISVAAHLMEWKHVRHIPVEDEDGGLVGLVSSHDVIRQYGERAKQGGGSVAVKVVMNPDPVTVGPETPMLEAIRLLSAEQADCLPVVKEGHLIGIVTEHDFVHIVARLLQAREVED